MRWSPNRIKAVADTRESTLANSASQQPGENTIGLNLEYLEQLFNTMDPSPFHEKDIDQDAEEFIVSWAREYPLETPMRLVVHLQNPEQEGDVHNILERALHNHFKYKAESTRRELRQLLREGRISLVIGLSFLTLCLTTAEVLMALHLPGTRVLEESLHIGGWVAMWRPIEVYLYEWWPLRRSERTYRKLSAIPIEVRCARISPPEKTFREGSVKENHHV